MKDWLSKIGCYGVNLLNAMINVFFFSIPKNEQKCD